MLQIDRIMGVQGSKTSTLSQIEKNDQTRSVVVYKDHTITDAKMEKLCEALRKNRSVLGAPHHVKKALWKACPI